MIEVIKGENVIQIKGHAGYAERGKDIVCAAVSGIWYALVGKMERESRKRNLTYTYLEKDGEVCIEVTWVKHSKEICVWEAFDTVLCGMELIAAQYPENLSIKNAGGGL